MFTAKELVEEFNFIGVDGLDDKIVKKCIEIATRYNIDAERFVEEWIAFAQTNLGGMLKPTAVTLDTMERKQLSRNAEKSNVKLEIKAESVVAKGDSVVIYDNTDVNKILNTYNSAGTTPEKFKQGIKRDASTLSSSPLTCNPDAFKPSAIYLKRKDALKVVETFGLNEKREDDSKKCAPVKITFLGKELWESTVQSAYMYETPIRLHKIANNRIDQLGNLLKKKYYPNGPPPNEHLVYGRIIDSKHESDDLIFETTNGGMGRAEVVTLSVANVPSYSLFSGQVVLLDAKSKIVNNKTILTAYKVYSDAAPELPQQIPIFPPNSGPMRIVVAAGSFALEYNLAYEPYHDLIKNVVNNPPDVLILIGPFISENHELLCDLGLDHIFEEFFESLLEKVIVPLQHTDTQIVIVPSLEDAHHHSVFPTPPYDLPSHLEHLDKVHMVSDPAMLDINGVLFGVSSLDILEQLDSRDMVRHKETNDRINVLVERMFAQRSFFPVHYKNAARRSLRQFELDVSLLHLHGHFDVMPHVMILPSRKQYFVKNVNGCVVVNPARLSDLGAGGTFAEMHIYPNATQQSLADNITCKIIKI